MRSVRRQPTSWLRCARLIREVAAAVVLVLTTSDYVGLLGTVEVPFRLRKKDGAWKVLPEPYFEWPRAMGSI